MLTMSRISPFCKRKHPLSIPSKWWFDRCKTRHRTNSFIPANLPLLSPPFSNFIVSRRCAVCLKRRERERESGRRNWQTKRANGTWPLWFTKRKIKGEEKKEKERRDVEMETKWRWIDGRTMLVIKVESTTIVWSIYRIDVQNLTSQG